MSFDIFVIEHQEVSAIRQQVEDFVAAFATVHPDLSDDRLDFALIAEASARALPVRAIQAFPRLSFPLETSANDGGLRFVLWKPLVEFLEKSFTFEVEDWLCNGEVALVHLTAEPAAFVRRIIAPIEQSRRAMPFRSEEAGFCVALNELCRLELQLKQEDPPASNIIRQIHERFQRLPETSIRLRQELIRLADQAPDWLIELCVEFLKQQAPDQAADAFNIQLASEEALASSWNSDEEDRAWHNL